MKKSKSKRSGGSEPEIPATVMKRLRQAFQEPARPEFSCPELEQVIGCALDELEGAEQQKVQAHLLTCRYCLELFLDVRLARADADSLEAEELTWSPLETLQKPDWLMGIPLEAPQKPDSLRGIPLGAPQKTGWPANFGSKVRETLQVLLKPRKLIPALAAVSLVVLAVFLGRSRVLPPTQLALEQPAAPPTVLRAAPSQELAAAKPSPALPGTGLLASKQKFKTAAPVLEKSTAPTGGLSQPGSIRLDFHEVPAPAGGARLSYRADRDAFAYLLRQDRSGNIDLLFSGKLEGGKTYFYPAPDQLFKSDLATVYLIASDKPVGDLETKIRELDHRGITQIHNLLPGSTIKSLTVKP